MIDFLRNLLFPEKIIQMFVVKDTDLFNIYYLTNKGRVIEASYLKDQDKWRNYEITIDKLNNHL
jgi:hypothetical protein